MKNLGTSEETGEMRQRKRIRLEHYDYSAPGKYFVTVCTANRETLFWSDSRGELCSPDANDDTGEHSSPLRLNLSYTGALVEREIQKISRIYDAVFVDKYCIMPDHIHMIISIESDECGKEITAPTLSRILKQFKGSITKQLGKSIWQKSFYEHTIRSQQDYDETWEYIENNPCSYINSQEQQ